MKKNVCGWLMVVGGIALILFASHEMNRVEEAKGAIENFTDFFSKNTMWNPLVTFFGGKAYEEAAKYDAPLFAIYTSGFIVAVGGVVILLLKNKPKSK